MAIDFTGQVIDNTLLSRLDAPIGTYRESDLTLTQFLAETPGNWVLADGQSCTGSAYATVTGKTNVPDLRGRGFRMKDHGAGRDSDGERSLGSSQDDSMQGHGHDFYVGNTSSGFAHPNSANQIALADNAGARTLKSANGGQQDIINAPKALTNGTPRTGNETRMKNVCVNIFIKIGY